MDSPRGGKGCRIASSRRDERSLERAIFALQEVRGLVRRQEKDPVLGKVREARGGEVESREGERMARRRW